MDNHPRHVRKANLQEITNNNTVEIANRLMNNTMMSGKKSFINKKPNFFFQSYGISEEKNQFNLLTLG